MTPSRTVAMLLMVVTGTFMVAGGASQEQERAPRGDAVAEPSTTYAVLIPVRLPLSGSADQVVMAAASKALKSMPTGDTRHLMIFSFEARDGATIGGTEFERALSLARFLAGDEFRRVRTVAYVPASVEGHAVLPILACEEIVMHPDAELGAAGRGERAVDATMRTAYQELAERRRTIPVPVVLGMLDPQLTVLEVQLVGGGTRYVLSDQLASLRDDVEIWKQNTLVGPGDLLVLSGREMRVKPGFACQLASDRKELADVLNLAPDSIQDNVVSRQVWRALRIDLHGRINARMVEDVTRAVRDAERRGEANLLCLSINSPGGPAVPALNLVQLLAGLDSQALRTVAFVDGQARSVAALVALAADETYAAPDAVLGGPGDTVIEADEREAMRLPVQELAQAKNRDWSLPLGLVDPDLKVYRCVREGTGTVRYLGEDELNALQTPELWSRDRELPLESGVSGEQARDYGLVVDCVDSMDDLLSRYHIEEDIRVAQRNSVVNAIERLATQAWFARTLLFVAFFALISEASAPGIGVAGFVSGLCFLLFFWCQFLNGTAGWLELILFAAGITCIALEVFVIPGFGVFGIGGAAMVLASIVLASQTFVFPRNTYQMNQLPGSVLTLATGCGGVLVAIWFMRRLLADSWLFRRLALTPPSEDLELDRLESLVDWEHLVGKSGVATTQLTPSGKARFGDDVVNVISDGLVVTNGTRVRVLEVRGNRVLVEPIEES